MLFFGTENTINLTQSIIFYKGKFMNIYSNNDINLLKRLSESLIESEDCHNYPNDFINFINKEL